MKLNENEEQPKIIPLRLRPQAHSFSIFSLQYSVDGSEIIGGSNDTCIYIYDLHQQKRILRVNSLKKNKKFRNRCDDYHRFKLMEMTSMLFVLLIIPIH